MKKKSGKRTILLRYAVVIALILLFSATIMSKVVDTSVFTADRWNEKASKLLDKETVIYPERGNILASDGSVLATNLDFYTIRMDYRAGAFSEDTLRKYVGALSTALAREFPPRTATEWQEHLLKPLDKPQKERSRWYKLLANLSYSDVQKIKGMPFFKGRGANKSGLIVETVRRRVRPYGDMARRSVGGVGETVESREIHGRSGLECALDSLLYGVPGVAEKKNMTRGIYDWTKTEAVPGYDVVTTIDINMQDIVENELNSMLSHVQADWGVAVLMDVATGDIKAISNLECTKDGNDYIEAMNRAVLGYEPGSVVKTLSMLIALEEGAVTDIDEEIPTGKCTYMGRPITDSHPTTSLKVREVLEHSSNIGMTRIITRRFEENPGEFYSKIKNLGFLEPMHTGIAGEAVPRIDSVPSNRGGRLVLSRQCFGYATEIPPMYTLALYNAIANDGAFVRPRLYKRLINKAIGVDTVLPVTYIKEKICSRENAAILRDMLRQVVWGEHGTGRMLRDEHVALAGKTGTAYMIEDGQYVTSKKRLTFCGYFPADNPKYSCIVMTCAPKANWFGAASTSGQIMKNIALKMYSRGMLGDHSDYRAEVPHNDVPRIAAIGDDRRDELRDAFDIGGKLKVLRMPAGETRAGHVPSVTGMDLRSAIAVIESAGYNVSHSGNGYVVASSPAPGTPAKAGTKVELTLQ